MSTWGEEWDDRYGHLNNVYEVSAPDGHKVSIFEEGRFLNAEPMFWACTCGREGSHFASFDNAFNAARKHVTATKIHAIAGLVAA